MPVLYRHPAEAFSCFLVVVLMAPLRPLRHLPSSLLETTRKHCATSAEAVTRCQGAGTHPLGGQGGRQSALGKGAVHVQECAKLALP